MQRHPRASLPTPFSARLVILGALALGAGCNQRLTPELVRTLLDEPKGTVSNTSMARVTRDLFQAERGTSAESFAQLFKLDQGSGDGLSGATGVPGLSLGVLDTTADVFCVGGLVAGIATFDACELGDECESELTLDSCVLRVGDQGVDEDARGKIKFTLDNTVQDSFARSALGIQFDGWESSRDDSLLDVFAGGLALETTLADDDASVDVVFASDLDLNLKRKVRGWFDDGIEEHTNVASGVRFRAAQDGEGGSGSLEVLSFVDEDGGRDESVVIKLAAESHQVDAAAATANAALEVVGENGTFACTWAAAEADASRDGVKVTSAGDCVDEDGQSFTFSGEALAD